MKAKYAEAQPQGRQIGTLRVAKVTYDHHPLHQGGDMSIGQMIDQHISETIKTGTMVSEVTLIFETVEQQHELAMMYRESY